MTLRAAFVTIGQSPRSDLTPALLARIGPGIDVVEHGALDDLDAAGVAAMAPGEGEPRLVTRLRGGDEAVIGKLKTQARLQQLFDRLDREGYDALVLLCTGYFPGLGAKTLVVEAQRVVDHMTYALAEGVQKLGVMVPHEAQVAEIHDFAPPGVTVLGAHASPYSGDRFAEAGRALADCDLIVMHCMGYEDSQREAVRAASGRPVLLAQRMLAAGVSQMV
jgi:protein AroM